MSNDIKVGVFSPNDPRSWVREENIDLMIEHERSLIKSLLKEGISVIRGGDGLEKMDQIAWNTELVKRHIKKIAKEKPDALIINQGSWTFPYDSIDAVRYFMQETNDIARVVIFSYKDTQVPGLVAGMATGGGLNRIGFPFVQCYGIIDKDSSVLKNLIDILNFFKKRSESKNLILNAIKKIRTQKYLSIGGMSLRMPTTTADVDQWQKIFGISYEALDQSELVFRANKMVIWKGKAGESNYRIIDKRLKKSLDFIFKEKHGIFDFTREKLRSLEKFVYQLSIYYAALDICKEYDINFVGIKCQDELSSKECTACIATAFLGNDIGPDGNKKKIIPVACENDMDSALTQLILHLISSQPAGFGDFRDIENGIITIQNCGQHPPYFFGGPYEDPIKKLNSTEYMGQEIFYFAGGSSVRGRTPGGNIMTIARLGRENLRYYLVAAVIETIDVSISEHKNFNYSWPLIRGKINISDGKVIDVWPCNHLGFTYGDLTPQLAELSQRLDIGYKIYSFKGKEYSKPT